MSDLETNHILFLLYKTNHQLTFQPKVVLYSDSKAI